MTETKKTKQTQPPARAELPFDAEARALGEFRAHVAVLRSMGACQVTASFGPDIVFTATFPEDQEPHGVH